MSACRMSHGISAKFLIFIRCHQFSEIFGVNMVLNLCIFVVTALFCRTAPSPATCTQPQIGGYFVFSLGKFFGVCVCVWGGGGGVAHIANNGEHDHIRFYLQIL